MRKQEKSLSELNEEVVLLLGKTFGFVNTFRFINQFTKGNNNYTEDRKIVYKNYPLDEIISEIKTTRKKRKSV